MSDPATLAFKSRLSGVLCQRLSENPDKWCCKPRNCQNYILHLHSTWQFYLSGIFLPSIYLCLPDPEINQITGDPSIFDTEYPQLCLCHVWSTVHGVIISASLVRRSSWKLLLSGGEVGKGEWRMRKGDQGASARQKFHNHTMRIHTLIKARPRALTFPLPTRLEGNRLH